MFWDYDRCIVRYAKWHVDVGELGSLRSLNGGSARSVGLVRPTGAGNSSSVVCWRYVSIVLRYNASHAHMRLCGCFVSNLCIWFSFTVVVRRNFRKYFIWQILLKQGEETCIFFYVTSVLKFESTEKRSSLMAVFKYLEASLYLIFNKIYIISQ